MAVMLANQRGLPLTIWVVGYADSMGEDAAAEIAEQTRRAAVKLCEVLESRA